MTDDAPPLLKKRLSINPEINAGTLIQGGVVAILMIGALLPYYTGLLGRISDVEKLAAVHEYRLRGIDSQIGQITSDERSSAADTRTRLDGIIGQLSDLKVLVVAKAPVK